MTTTKAEPEFCFCSLALGHKYRSLALLLAKDLEKYSPHTSFIVLTDHPSDFSQQPNVLAFKHRQQGVSCYHEKRFVIAKALSMFNSCIFMDADMRILAPVPQDMEWLRMPGVTARICDFMPERYSKVFDKTASVKICREFKVTQKAAEKFNLELNDQVKFVYEFLFAITKDAGKEIDFLNSWDVLAPYFELNGIYDAEGNAIGLAAAKAGLRVRWSAMDGVSFFKDKTELVRIQKGQSKMEEMSKYFDQQRMLEYPSRSIFERIVVKLGKIIKNLYNLVRLRIASLKKFDFYYR